MPKLFTGIEPVKVHYSAEEFVDYYAKANVVACEAVTDYLFAIKDKVNTLVTGTFSNTDVTLLDATANRFQVQSILKRVHFSELAHEVVDTPERFHGDYVHYLRAMVDVTAEAVPEVTQLLNNLKLAISGFINEYSENGVLSIYGKSYALSSEKLINKQKEKISKFFPVNKSNASARIKDVISKNSDIDTLFNESKQLEANINHVKLKDIIKLSEEVSEMVDVLIEQNSKSGILLKNDAAKRDLVEMIHVGATGIQFISYLYANAVYFFKALESLSNAVLIVGKR